MIEYHCVMTLQSFWNGKPSAAHTYTTFAHADTAAELYGTVHTRAMEWWRKENPQISMGRPVVLHWSFTPNLLPSELPAGSGTTVEAREPGEESVSQERLAAWLVGNGYAEERPGYGHIDGDRLAEALLARFTLSESA